jgi:site-specific DNA-methyltransferase (adenine-specific)
MIYQKTGCPYPSKNRYYQNFEFMFVFSKNTPKSTNIISDRENIYSGYTVNRPKSGNRQIDGSIRQKGCDKKGVERKVKDFGVRYNIWRISHADKSRSLHPATFPLQLSQDHVISWSNEGDLICDPFMGSGTTGVACMNTNRRFIGIEKEKQYFDIAQKRIEDATKQGKIWK